MSDPYAKTQRPSPRSGATVYGPTDRFHTVNLALGDGRITADSAYITRTIMGRKDAVMAHISRFMDRNGMPEAILHTVIVKPQFTGLGLGSELLAAVHDFADANGWSMWVEASGTLGGSNEHFRHWFETHGWVRSPDSHFVYYRKIPQMDALGRLA